MTDKSTMIDANNPLKPKKTHDTGDKCTQRMQYSQTTKTTAKNSKI